MKPGLGATTLLALTLSLASGCGGGATDAEAPATNLAADGTAAIADKAAADQDAAEAAAKAAAVQQAAADKAAADKLAADKAAADKLAADKAAADKAAAQKAAEAAAAQNAAAAPVAAGAREYANCPELNADYPQGVGRPGAKDTTSTGDPVTDPVTEFTVNQAVYDANTKSDRDDDGIACEKR